MMLRKQVASSSSKPRRPRDQDGGEKSTKLRRKTQQSQFRTVLVFLGIALMLTTVAIVKFRHKSKYTPQVLRSRRAKEGSDGIANNNNNNNEKQRGGIELHSDFSPPNSIYNLSVLDDTNKMVSLKQFQGMVTLIVNVACHWGKTQTNYVELVQLQERFKDQGFSVLAFPTNDYRQELGSNEEIRSFLDENFPDVINFPIFGLSSLKENPVYQRLEEQLPESHVKHNFFKYLVDRNGNAVTLFHKKQDPMTLVGEIEEVLDRAGGPPKHKVVTS
jgi:glutathione peroxidase